MAHSISLARYGSLLGGSLRVISVSRAASVHFRSSNLKTVALKAVSPGMRHPFGVQCAPAIYINTRGYATQPAVASTPVKQEESVYVKARAIVGNVKTFFIKMRDGWRLFRSNRKQAKEFRRIAAAESRELNFSEFVVCRQSDRDLRKLIPFILFTLEFPEFLPLVLYYFPNFLPSTFETAAEKSKRLGSAALERISAVVNIYSEAAGAGLISGGARSFGGLLSTADLEQLVTLTPARALALAREKLGTPDVASLPKPLLDIVSRHFAVPGFLPQSYRRGRVSRVLQELATDDGMMRLYGVDRLTWAELRDACHLRALPVPPPPATSASPTLASSVDPSLDAPRRHLTAWLEATTGNQGSTLPMLLLTIARTAVASEEMDAFSRLSSSLSAAQTAAAPQSTARPNTLAPRTPPKAARVEGARVAAAGGR